MRSERRWPARRSGTDKSAGSKRACMRPAWMREKSSKVLTSLASRNPLRWMSSSSCRACSLTSVSAQQLVDGSEDERERGAELVADAGEERGLGLIEFGQRLGTLLLGLVAARAADPGGDVTGHHFDKAAITVVEPAMPVQPGHEESRAARRPAAESAPRAPGRAAPARHRSADPARGRRARSVRIHPGWLLRRAISRGRRAAGSSVRLGARG